jgi:hypothetical protein
MRGRAALAGAAVAAGWLALMAGPSSASTVLILSSVDPSCCSIPDPSTPQYGSDGTPQAEAIAASPRSSAENIPPPDGWQTERSDSVTANDAANDESEKAGDSLGPDAVGLKESAGLNDNSPDGVNLAEASEASVLERVMMILTDLRAVVIRNP